MVKPLSNDASCYYGKATKWCTSGKTGNLFYYYTLKGYALYFLLDKTPSEPVLGKIIIVVSEYAKSAFGSDDKHTNISNVPDNLLELIDQDAVTSLKPDTKEIDQTYDMFDQSGEQNDNILAFIGNSNSSTKTLEKLFPAVLNLPVNGMFQGNTPMNYKIHALHSILAHKNASKELKAKAKAELKIIKK